MKQPKKSTTFKNLLIKKLSLSTTAVAVAGVFMMAPIQAQATALNWSNLSGGTPGAFILLDTLNTVANPQLYTAITNVGADNTLSNGDTFSEHLVLLTTSSSLGGGVDFGLGGDYRFDVSLSGEILNVGGTPIVINSNNTVSSGVSSVFDIEFTGAVIGLFNNATNEHIADLTFQSGGGSSLQLLAGSVIGDITLNALLGPGCVTCDPYLATEAGGTITGTQYLTITTGSARFVSFAGSSFVNHTLVANLRDNGEASTFVQVPEPGSLALLGIGLLGLGAFRRAKKI